MPRFLRTALLLSIGVAYLYPVTQVFSRVGDEGILIYGAQRVSEGAIPGRDFLEVMGPGAFYWLALLFKLFGAGWQVTRLYLLFIGVASVTLLYDIARQVCREWVAILCWLFVLVLSVPLWPAISHHWDSNFFCILALWCFLKLEKTGRWWWAVAVGALAGIASCTMQQKGFLLLGALMASAALRRDARQRVWLLPGGYVAVGAVVLFAFWRAGAVRDLVYANIIWPLSGYGAINRVPYGKLLFSVAISPSLRLLGQNWRGVSGSVLSLIPFLAIAVLPLLAAASILPRLWPKEARRVWIASPLLPITLAGAALWISEMHRTDIFHLIYGSPILLIAWLASLDRIHKRAAIGLLGFCLVLFGALNFIAHRHGNLLIETRRGIVPSAANDDALRFLCTAVKPREPVFVYPYLPIYYYLADVTNPTRFNALLYGFNTPSQFEEVIRDLEGKRVRYVLWDTEVYGEKLVAWFPDYVQPKRRDLKLEKYIESNYSEIAVKNGFRIFQRHAKKGEREPGW